MSSRALSDVQPDGFFTDKLGQADPSVADAIAAELDRQQNQIELIASENIVSKAVLEAQGSVLTNKYAEGYPGRRYYQGCAPSDSVETLAIERAKQLFGCGFANASMTAPFACAPLCGCTFAKPQLNNCLARSIASVSTESEGAQP